MNCEQCTVHSKTFTVHRPLIPMFSLNTQILLGAILGVAGGIVLKLFGNESPIYLNTLYIAQIVGNIFVNLLKMVLIPLVFTSIVTGISNLRQHQQMKRVWQITLIFFLITPFIAASLGIASVHLFRLGQDNHIDSFKESLTSFSGTSLTFKEFSLKFIDGLFVNPVSAMASGNVMAVLIFAIFLAIGLIVLNERVKTTLQFFNELYELMMLLTNLIMKIAPIGIMALLIKLIATQDLAIISILGKYMAVVIGITLFHGLIVLPTLLFCITGYNPIKFFIGMREALITALSTSSSSATLPITMRCLTENLKVDKNIVQFVCPLGATANMDGTAMYEAVAALFVANLCGIDLNVGQQIVVVLMSVLASIGAPGIPSAGMVTMIMVFQSVGLPIEAIAILLPIDRPLDAVRTMVNVEGDGIGSLVVEKLSKKEKKMTGN